LLSIILEVSQPFSFVILISFIISGDLYMRRNIVRLYAQESRLEPPTNFEYHMCVVRYRISISRYQYINIRTISPVRFEVLTAVVMKISMFWDITPCSP
jgi:hypothetical protein